MWGSLIRRKGVCSSLLFQLSFTNDLWYVFVFCFFLQNSVLSLSTIFICTVVFFVLLLIRNVIHSFWRYAWYWMVTKYSQKLPFFHLQLFIPYLFIYTVPIKLGRDCQWTTCALLLSSSHVGIFCKYNLSTGKNQYNQLPLLVKKKHAKAYWKCNFFYLWSNFVQSPVNREKSQLNQISIY